jgi:hypothetical protein
MQDAYVANHVILLDSYLIGLLYFYHEEREESWKAEESWYVSHVVQYVNSRLQSIN